MTCWTMGAFVAAREHLEIALAISREEGDSETKSAFGLLLVPLILSSTGIIVWDLGEVERARSLMDEATRHVFALNHAPSAAYVLAVEILLDLRRGDPHLLTRAEELVRLSDSNGLPFFLAVGEMGAKWARAKIGGAKLGVTEYYKAITGFSDQGNRLFLPLFRGLLAELEMEAGDLNSALAHVDESIALGREIEDHGSDVVLHSIRGEILLRLNPTDPAAAERAFQTALAVAERQRARSHGLLAALKLAELYHSSGRAADAHAALAPALEGFSPTREFPEIAEAHTLLATTPS